MRNGYLQSVFMCGFVSLFILSFSGKPSPSSSIIVLTYQLISHYSQSLLLRPFFMYLCDRYTPCRQSEETDICPAVWDLVVTIGEEKHAVKTSWENDTFSVEIDDKVKMDIDTDWLVGEPMMLANINGKEVTVQVCMGHG